MAAGAGNFGILKHLVCDRFLSGSLNGFYRQLVAEFAFAPVLIELGVFKMTKMAGGLGNLKFFLIGLVLVTGSAVYLLSLDLLFFVEMRFMHKESLFGKFNLFGLEIIICLSVTVRGHATGIADPRSGSDGFTTKLNVGEALRRIFRNVFDFCCGA